MVARRWLRLLCANVEISKLSALKKGEIRFSKNIPTVKSCGNRVFAKVLFEKLLQKLSRRQYLQYIFKKRAKTYFIEGRF